MGNGKYFIIKINMNKFIKRYYAFLYYKHNILKRGIKPIDIKYSISIYLGVYVLCLLAIGYGIGKYYDVNLVNMVNFQLIYAQIFLGISIVIVFIYVYVVTRKVDYRNYKFDYKSDNIFYTIYETIPFILIILLVFLLR